MNDKKAEGSKKKNDKTSKKDSDIIAMHEFIKVTLDDDKAQEIASIDLEGKTQLADFMVVATGTSSRHIVSLAQNLKDKLKEKFGINSKIEGTDTGDWVILDAGDVIVHLFRHEVREFYNLEKLWSSDFATVDYTRYKS